MTRPLRYSWTAEDLHQGCGAGGGGGEGMGLVEWRGVEGEAAGDGKSTGTSESMEN